VNRWEHADDCDVGWCVCPSGDGKDRCLCGSQRRYHTRADRGHPSNGCKEFRTREETTLEIDLHLQKAQKLAEVAGARQLRDFIITVRGSVRGELARALRTPEAIDRRARRLRKLARVS